MVLGLLIPLAGEAAFDLHQALGHLDVSSRPEHLVIQKVSSLEVPMASSTGERENYYGDQRDITRFLQKIMNGLTAIVAAIAIYFIVLNAFMLVTAFGDSDKISKAKSGLTWSGAGFLLIVFSYIIVKTIVFITYSGDGLRTEDLKGDDTNIHQPGSTLGPDGVDVGSKNKKGSEVDSSGDSATAGGQGGNNQNALDADSAGSADSALKQGANNGTETETDANGMPEVSKVHGEQPNDGQTDLEEVLHVTP